MVKVELLVVQMLVLSSLILGANAWGTEGHFMICRIAQDFLSPETLNKVSKLLAARDLSSVCSWADGADIRSRYPWATPLHYANTPGNSQAPCTFVYSRDCQNPNGEKNMCVVGAINNYTAQLQTYGSPTNYNLTESLMFLSHFVGDIHQPLHVGCKADRGGTTIKVRWYNTPTNLHKVWDTLMIRKAMADVYHNDADTMRSDIQGRQLNQSTISKWQKCSGTWASCVNTYASESIYWACRSAYLAPKSIRDPYFNSRRNLVEERIAQAGVRLAAILNQNFGKSSNEGKLSSY